MSLLFHEAYYRGQAFLGSFFSLFWLRRREESLISHIVFLKGVRVIKPRIPATIITGFLGAGKTTLIRHLMTQAVDARLALIINEFGDVGVDGALAKACGAESCDADSIIELANGCICCTVADDFLPSMEALLERDPLPTRIIIETSGLALPQPLVQAFHWPSIRARVMLDGVVSVVDGVALSHGRVAADMDALETQRQLDPELDHHTPINALFHDQISAANILVMSKADMMTQADISAVREKLTRLTKGTTPILEVNTATAPLDAIFGLGLEDEARARSEHAHHHHHHDEHDHDDFKTLILSLDAVDDPADLITAIKQCAEKHGILRIKGFVSVKGKVAPLVVQGVGARVEHYYAPHPAQDAGQLVVIGYADMDAAGLAVRLNAQLQ